MGEKKGTAVDAEGSGGPIQQVAVSFCGPQLDPAGYGRPEGLRLNIPEQANFSVSSWQTIGE